MKPYVNPLTGKIKHSNTDPGKPFVPAVVVHLVSKADKPGDGFPHMGSYYKTACGKHSPEDAYTSNQDAVTCYGCLQSLGKVKPSAQGAKPSTSKQEK